MPLDMKQEISKLRYQYEKDTTQSTFNCLVTSESGCGKTYMARTCRFPVHIDSFDPGGSKGLKKWIDSGDIVVDTRYEAEDAIKPTAYKLWKSEFKRRVEGGYFRHFGTYFIDSGTTFAQAIMNWVMQKDGVAGQAPRFTKDYTPQKFELRNQIKKCLNLPCDFILTAHLRLLEDPESGRHKFRLFTTGDGMIILPLLFDELYTLRTVAKSSDVNYQLLTKSTGLYLARSRIGSDKLNAVEEPNIKALLKKSRFPSEDKPKLTWE
jgi:hypothetical protein